MHSVHIDVLSEAYMLKHRRTYREAQKLLGMLAKLRSARQPGGCTRTSPEYAEKKSAQREDKEGSTAAGTIRGRCYTVLATHAKLS